MRKEPWLYARMEPIRTARISRLRLFATGPTISAWTSHLPRMVDGHPTIPSLRDAYAAIRRARVRRVASEALLATTRARITSTRERMNRAATLARAPMPKRRMRSGWPSALRAHSKTTVSIMRPRGQNGVVSPRPRANENVARAPAKRDETRETPTSRNEVRRAVLRIRAL
jgi:hypothetical protein